MFSLCHKKYFFFSTTMSCSASLHTLRDGKIYSRVVWGLLFRDLFMTRRVVCHGRFRAALASNDNILGLISGVHPLFADLFVAPRYGWVWEAINSLSIVCNLFIRVRQSAMSVAARKLLVYLSTWQSCSRAGAFHFSHKLLPRCHWGKSFNG
jgi:hypothetical protein